MTTTIKLVSEEEFELWTEIVKDSLKKGENVHQATTKADEVLKRLQERIVR